MSEKSYVFTSARLGFRNWLEEDVDIFSSMNADPQVMEFFPNLLTAEQTKAFVKTMQVEFFERGFCYFAVDELESGNFIGFIGLHQQTFEASFTPCIDIGWRLHPYVWNKGLATEGASSCLKYAYHVLGIQEVYAIAPKVNIPSEQVMKKIGMKKITNFYHPLLEKDLRLRECVVYKITGLEFTKCL